jgi:hypothetical protein
MKKKFSIILPFKNYNKDSDFGPFLESLNEQKEMKSFEIIFVYSNKRIVRNNISRIRKKLRKISKHTPIRFYTYRQSLGPSHAWCFGIRKAKSEYVCLLALDSKMKKDWAEKICKNVNKYDMYLGNYCSGIRQDRISKIEAGIDKSRFEGKVIDFRNFIAKRRLLLKILKETFRDRYFADCELDVFVRKKLHTEVHQIDSARVFNDYPKNISGAMKRKFRHGIGVGRTYRYFELGLNDAKIEDWAFPFVKIIYFLTYGMKNVHSRTNKAILLYLNTIFYLGYLGGFLLPKDITKRVYAFHFDET